MSRERKAYETALRRQAGASPEHRRRLEQAMESKDDWRGTCGRCGEELSGTLSDLRSHREECSS